MLNKYGKKGPPSGSAILGAVGQRGVTLLVVLVILLVVAVIGLGAARVSLLGEKSTRYDRDRQVAWEAAEAALVDAQYDIAGPNTYASQRMAKFAPGNLIGFTTGCGTSGPTQGLCLPNVGGKPVAYDIDFTATGSAAHSVALGTFTGRSFSSGSGIAPIQAPRYIIEAIPDVHLGSSVNAPSGLPQPYIYRVTAMGFGPRQDVQVVLQMVFRKGV